MTAPYQRGLISGRAAVASARATVAMNLSRQALPAVFSTTWLKALSRLAAAAGLVFGFMVGLCNTAAAQPQAAPLSTPPSCAASPVYPLPAGTPALQALLAQLNAQTPLCLQNAPFYAWRGAVLLALRQPAAAAEALERALLLDPNLPGAQLDYADALLGVGDTASARGLLSQVAQRTDLPANLRPVLSRELAAIDPNVWRTRWLFSTAQGTDSNLNNAPAASELTLTFPQGPVTLSLLEASRPQRGSANLSTAQWLGIKPVGSQLWLLQAELRSRHTDSSATRYQQADVSASWLQAPDAPRQWIVRTGLTKVDFGGQALLQGARLSVLHQWQPVVAPAVASTAGQGGYPAPNQPAYQPANQPSQAASACRPSAGLEAEARRYPVSPELNGRYTGLLAAVNCSVADVPGSSALQSPLLSQQQLGLQLRLGSDQPDNGARPGGSNRRLEVRATWEARLGAYKASTDYNHTRQLDASGYSLLLADNLARRISRHSLRAELARPLPGGWLGGADGFVSFEVNRQSSNLAAFESRQQALYTGLRWLLD